MPTLRDLFSRHCPKCKSRLYPADDQSMATAGLCSYCAGQAERAARQAAEAESDAHREWTERYHQATKMPWED